MVSLEFFLSWGIRQNWIEGTKDETNISNFFRVGSIFGKSSWRGGGQEVYLNVGFQGYSKELVDQVYMNTYILAIRRREKKE